MTADKHILFQSVQSTGLSDQLGMTTDKHILIKSVKSTGMSDQYKLGMTADKHILFKSVKSTGLSDHLLEKSCLLGLPLVTYVICLFVISNFN